MIGKVLLVLGGTAFYAAILLIRLSEIRYNLKYGYVPIGWRKKDRVLRAEEPFFFWAMTKGQFFFMAITALFWLSFCVWLLVSA